jgi:hypothetical protein
LIPRIATGRTAAMSHPSYKLREMPNRAERPRAEGLGLALSATAAQCRIDLDGWDPEIAKGVWSDPRPEALQRGFIELAELLAELVDDPTVVTLVIPFDIAEAVQRREPDVPYTLERGSGIVGGRTMSLPDGRIDVIINAGWLLAYDENNVPILNREPMKVIRRGLVHEAQHVVMQQRASGFDEYGFNAVEGMFNRQLAANASKLCDEHRAEWHAVRLTEPEPPTTGAVTDVLEALGRQLSAANQAYQAANQAGLDGPDAVYSLAVAVFTASEPFWTSLGYWTAQYRTGDADITDIPAEITAVPLWQRYAGNVWSLLQDSLLTLPVEDLTTGAEALDAAAREVAATLTSSLETLGFGYEDSGAGQAFYINRWDFPDE